MGECNVVKTLKLKIVLPSGEIREARELDVTKPKYIFRYNKYIRYTHMATIEKLTNPLGTQGILMTAWQAAPAAKIQGAPVRMAVEGLPEQRIWLSWSKDDGRTWVKAFKVITACSLHVH
jgi:hypothetical protein